MEGFVTKRSRGQKSFGFSVDNWKVRWFKVDSGEISYYGKNKEKIKGSFPLSADSLVMTHPDVGCYKHIILVKVSADAEHDLTFSTDSKDLQSKWMEAIILQINLKVGEVTVVEKRPSDRFKFNMNGLQSTLGKYFKEPTHDSTVLERRSSDHSGPGIYAYAGDGTQPPPQELPPIAEEESTDEPTGEEMVAVSEHPVYKRYFKMLTMGLPETAAKNKMMLDKLDPSVMDLDPQTKVPLNEEPKPYVGASKPPIFAKPNPLAGGLAGLKFKLPPGGGLKPKEPEVQVRKKKLFLKTIRQSKVGADSMWGGADVDFDDHDKEDFEKFFVETIDPNDINKKKADATKSTGKPKVVVVIDGKRAQNASIALARLRIPFHELRHKVVHMDDTNLTLSQLQSLREHLPTVEEVGLLKKYCSRPSVSALNIPHPEALQSSPSVTDSDGEENVTLAHPPSNSRLALLGAGESYMLAMIGIHLKDDVNMVALARRLDCMIYKQQFDTRIQECICSLDVLASGCEAVRKCAGLRKVLMTVLRVGNQMNDGGDKQHGFTLDGLCKLQSAKAFDKKTSVLQYIVMLVRRHDEQALLFPEEISPRIQAAARIMLDSVQTEKNDLQVGMKVHLPLIEGIQAKKAAIRKEKEDKILAAIRVEVEPRLDELIDEIVIASVGVASMTTRRAAVKTEGGEADACVNRFGSDVAAYNTSNARVAPRRRKKNMRSLSPPPGGNPESEKFTHPNPAEGVDVTATEDASTVVAAADGASGLDSVDDQRPLTIYDSIEHHASPSDSSPSNDTPVTVMDDQDTTQDNTTEVLEDATAVDTLPVVNNTVFGFFASGQAQDQCDALDEKFDDTKEVYLALVAYFGEDPSMPCQDFFASLNTFIQDFVKVREVVARLEKAEERKKRGGDKLVIPKKKAVSVASPSSKNDASAVHVAANSSECEAVSTDGELAAVTADTVASAVANEAATVSDNVDAPSAAHAAEHAVVEVASEPAASDVVPAVVEAASCSSMDHVTRMCGSEDKDLGTGLQVSVVSTEEKNSSEVLAVEGPSNQPDGDGGQSDGDGGQSDGDGGPSDDMPEEGGELDESDKTVSSVTCE